MLLSKRVDGMLAGLVAVLTAVSLAGAQEQGPAPVVASPIVERDVRAGQTFVGTVKPLKESVVGSAVSGRVIEFPINEGDWVEKGQPLTRLRTGSLEIELAGAQAELKLRQEELAELKNGSRPEEIEQARARMKAAEATMAYQEAKYRRTKRLFESQQSRAVSEEQLDEALSKSVEAEQSYLQFKAAYDLAVKGPRQEKIAQAEARVAQQKEAVAQIQDRINKHTLVAPFNGYVIAEHTEEGEWLSSGEPAAKVVALGHVDIQVHVPQDHIGYVGVGDKARVEFPALPEETLQALLRKDPPRVALVIPQADERSRTLPVKVRVENIIDEKRGPLIKAGLLSRVTLSVGPKTRSLLVPKDALVLGGERPLIYIVQRDSPDAQTGTALPVPVQPGVAEGRLIALKKVFAEQQLQPGQLVVVEGNERLRPEQTVKLKEVVSPGHAPKDRVATDD